MTATNISAFSCSVLSDEDGICYRKSYLNSTGGRTAFSAECDECDNYDEVMTAWGGAPTIDFSLDSGF